MVISRSVKQATCNSPHFLSTTTINCGFSNATFSSFQRFISSLIAFINAIIITLCLAVKSLYLLNISGPHSALVAKFTFHRRLGYYMIQTYVPSMLTVTISWFAFWISPDSPPARVGLGITTVLTMITISNSARAPLPKVSYTKAIDWFLLMCLVYVFGALMEYAIVNFYSCKVQHKRQKDNRKAEQEVKLHD